MLKHTLQFLLALFILLLSVVVISYYVSYAPHHSKLKNAIKSSKLELTGDTAQLYQLAIAAETKDGIRVRATRAAFYELSYSKREGRSTIVRHLAQILWNVATNVHFTEQETFYLWCHYAFNAETKGINSVAFKYFNEPILGLEISEQAQIVGMPHGPSAFIPGTERGKMRLEWGLKQYAHNQELQKEANDDSLN